MCKIPLLNYHFLFYFSSYYNIKDDIEIANLSSPSDVLNVSTDSHDECGHGHGHLHGGTSCEHAHSIQMV